MKPRITSSGSSLCMYERPLSTLGMSRFPLVDVNRLEHYAVCYGSVPKMVTQMAPGRTPMSKSPMKIHVEGLAMMRWTVEV